MRTSRSRPGPARLALACLLAGALVACLPAAPAPTPAVTVTPSARPILATAVPSPLPATSTATPGAATPAALVLIGGTLIDGTGAPPVPGAAVVIRAGLIVAAGPRAAVAIPDGALIVDVQGATILPGLINAHVHHAAGYDANLLAWAQAGVTTVRDEGPLVSGVDAARALYAARDATDADPQYARVVAASPMLTNPGGYGSLEVATPGEAKERVDEVLDAGADLIKIGIEDRQGNNTWPLIPEDIARAIAGEAHARGVWVSAHVTRARHLGLALDIGADEIAHMVYDEPVPDDVLARLVDAGVYWVPTLELYAGVGVDAPARDNLRRFVAAGGHVALGTDYDGYYVPFELGLPMTEMEQMQQAGMTPMQILMAATRDAAHVCGLDAELGTLEPGKRADVLVVDGDPLGNLRALQDVRMVIHDGVVVVGEAPAPTLARLCPSP